MFDEEFPNSSIFVPTVLFLMLFHEPQGWAASGGPLNWSFNLSAPLKLFQVSGRCFSFLTCSAISGGQPSFSRFAVVTTPFHFLLTWSSLGCFLRPTPDLYSSVTLSWPVGIVPWYSWCLLLPGRPYHIKALKCHWFWRLSSKGVHNLRTPDTGGPSEVKVGTLEQRANMHIALLILERKNFWHIKIFFPIFNF